MNIKEYKPKFEESVYKESINSREEGEQFFDNEGIEEFIKMAKDPKSIKTFGFRHYERMFKAFSRMFQDDLYEEYFPNKIRLRVNKLMKKISGMAMLSGMSDEERTDILIKEVLYGILKKYNDTGK